MSIETAGDPKRLAFGFDMVPDPDPAYDPVLRASWGRLQIWAGGRVLTAGLTEGETYRTNVECHLLPVVEWIVRNWDPMLHEERLPRPAQSCSADWYLGSLKALPLADDEMDRLMDARRAWWERHGLGAALPDFRIPDVHFRRLGDKVEVSWDDREWRSAGPGVEVLIPPGAVRLTAGEVAEILFDFCKGVLSRLLRIAEAGQRAEELLAELDDLRAPERQIPRLLLAAGQRIEEWARHLRQNAGLGDGGHEETVRELLGVSESPSGALVAEPTLPVLLYRCAAPDLSEGDLHSLLELCRLEADVDPSMFKRFRSPAAYPSSREEATAEGLELALDIREALGLPPDRPLTGELDLESKILPRMGVKIVERRLTDNNVDGAAIWRPSNMPLVVVNQSGRFGRYPWGRRMTLAHELCHLLHDGTEAGPVGVVSSEWAPYLAERRANAFAVMLLAPEAAMASVLDRQTDRWTRQDLKRALDALEVGVQTLTWQLHNLGWITESERQAWVDEFTSG